MTRFFTSFRRDSHPMAVMCGVGGANVRFYHDSTVTPTRTSAWWRACA